MFVCIKMYSYGFVFWMICGVGIEVDFFVEYGEMVVVNFCYGFELGFELMLFFFYSGFVCLNEEF